MGKKAAHASMTWQTYVRTRVQVWLPMRRRVAVGRNVWRCWGTRSPPTMSASLTVQRRAQTRSGKESRACKSDRYLNILQLSLPYAKSSITEPGIKPCGDHDLDHEVGEAPRWCTCLSSGSVIRQGYREVDQLDKLFYSKIKVKVDPLRIPVWEFIFPLQATLFPPLIPAVVGLKRAAPWTGRQWSSFYQITFF